MLRRASERQAAEMNKAGPHYTASGRVVVDQLGRALHPQTLTTCWRRLLRDAGVKRIRLHDARHTCGTLLHLQGVPMAVISAWLGHADPAFTMRTYIHSQEHALHTAADALTRTRDTDVTPEDDES